MILYRYIDNYDILEKQIAAFLDWLSDTETSRYSCYRKREDRLNFLLGRLMVKSVLNREDPVKVVLQADRYGKLHCLSGNASAYAHFNISHTDGFVAAIFSTSSPVGIDVEKIRETDYMEILNTVSSPEEMEFFRQSADPAEAFYTIWTVKEAFLKAEGTGFSTDPATLNSLQLTEDKNTCLSVKIMDRFFVAAVAKQAFDKENFKMVAFILDNKTGN